MYRSVALFACLIAFVAAQTVTELSLGTTNAVLAPVLTSTDAEIPQLWYKIWVPENVQDLTLVLTQTGTTCSGDIRANFHGAHVPCGTKWSTESNTNYPCREAETDYFTDTSAVTWNLYPSLAENRKVSPGSYAYLSFSRDVTSDYAEQCTFTIDATMTTCPAGKYCRQSGSSTCDCVAYSTITLPYSATWVANDSLTENDMRVWIPENTAVISVMINNTDYSTYVYGSNGFPGGSYNYYCYEVYSSVGSYYVLNLECYMPAPGWFYLYSYTYSTGYYLMGDVQIDIKTCPENMGGYNCTWAATNMTSGNAIASYGKVIAAGEGTNSQFVDAFNYYYFNNGNGTVATANITFAVTSGSSSWVYWNKGGYIVDNTKNYDGYVGATGSPQTVVLTWADFYAGGNIVVAISNEGTANVVYNVTSTAASPSTTSGTGVTAGATTGTTTGAGAVQIASFGLIAALLALLF